MFAAQVNDAGLSNTQFVTNLYEAFLQRGPDAGGLGFWSGQASVGSGRQNVLNAFAASSAFRELAGTLYREVYWLVADQLGTPRMVVNKSGSLASVKRHDYLPFGEEVFTGTGGRTPTQGYSSDSVRQKFTSKERDSETGLDYFLARYYSSVQGRFTSPDEFAGGPDELFDFAAAASENPTFYAELDNPQSLNKYQYTYNNPVNMVDADGHCPPCFGPSISGIGESLELISNPDAALDKLQLKISAVGMAPAAGEAADLVNAGISAARGNFSEAALDLTGALGPVGSGVAVANRFRKLAKVANKVDDAVEVGVDVSVKSGTTAKKAENLANADAKGIPRSQLGPSGKPKVITVKHATQKRAQDAAQVRSKGKPVKHVNPAKRRNHYHSTDKRGRPRKAKQNIHHEFPK